MICACQIPEHRRETLFCGITCTYTDLARHASGVISGLFRRISFFAILAVKRGACHDLRLVLAAIGGIISGMNSQEFVLVRMPDMTPIGTNSGVLRRTLSGAEAGSTSFKSRAPFELLFERPRIARFISGKFFS